MLEHKGEATLDELLEEARAAIDEAHDSNAAPGLSVYLEQVDPPEKCLAPQWDAAGVAGAHAWSTWTTWVTWVTWATR